jgi:hypothetical protein
VVVAVVAATIRFQVEKAGHLAVVVVVQKL